MAKEGWIKLYRQVQDCWIWQDKEPYDKRSAWVDLLLTANHHDKKILFNGELITIERGQILTSIRQLSAKWKWSVNKVYRFMKLLESENMLQKESNKDRTLITIVKYEVYQSHEYTSGNTSGNSDEYMSETPTETVTETPTETVTEHKQECKEYKNILSNSNELDCQTESVRRVLDEWNSLSSFGIKQISRFNYSSKRYQSLVARIKQYGIEDVLKAIDNIRHSDFLQGKVKGKRQWVITFDWFVLPNNFPKVLEGQYDNKDGEEAQNYESESSVRLW